MKENEMERLEFTSNGNGTCYVSGIGTCAESKIEIPDAYDGERVTGIGKLAFYNCTNLTDVVIPDSVTEIGASAFQGCGNLKDIEIPDSVKSIGGYAFLDCISLKSIRFIGTSDGWNAIAKGDHWNLLAPADVIFAPEKKKKIAGSKNIRAVREVIPTGEKKKSGMPKIILGVSLAVLLLIGGILFVMGYGSGKPAPEPEHIHDYIAQITEPTCTEQGYTTYTCACGESYTDDTVEALGHTPGAEATCTKNSACTACGEILQTANGHLPGTEATCTEAQTCLVCKTELKAALGHTPGAEATCTTAQKCTVCQAQLKAALDHTPGTWEIVTEATGTEGGLKIQKCTVCKAVLKEEVIPVISVSVGQTITFGSYEQDNNTSNGKEAIEWIVLDIQDGKALVISKYALDCKKYNETYTDVTWETCTLRTWLNNDFLNSAFSESEKSKIPTVPVSADANPSYSTNPGNATQDQIFLLSITEANKYFDSNSERECQPTAYAKAQGVWTSSSGTYAGNCWWWLRSPGNLQTYAAVVRYDGYVRDYGNGVYGSDDAVRPALWIDLES